MINFFAVNDGDYIKAVLDRNLAENISRVLYPNDNVRFFLLWIDFIKYSKFWFFSFLSFSAFQVMDKVISILPIIDSTIPWILLLNISLLKFI